jgi:hypothetical protein
MKVLLEVCYHSVARVTITPQERMIIAYAVKALAYVFLVEVVSLVPCSKRFDGAFFGFDVPLNLPTTSPFGFNLLGGD